MNRNFNPVLVGAQVQGTGMKHPRVPRVYIGSELNGYVQGDLMDANAISQYVTDKIRSISVSIVDYETLNLKITSLEQEDTRLSSLIDSTLSDMEDLDTRVQLQLALFQQSMNNQIMNAKPSINTTDNGDLIVIF